MHNHAEKEDWIEPWEWALESSDQTPRERKVEITCIVNLSCISVPSISQDRITSGGLDNARILDSLPWELGKSLALDKGATFLRSEAVLLRVGGVPDPVDEQVGGE